jgi:nascent polypeptide-associated complex subunit alpha
MASAQKGQAEKKPAAKKPAAKKAEKAAPVAKEEPVAAEKPAEKPAVEKKAAKAKDTAKPKKEEPKPKEEEPKKEEPKEEPKKEEKKGKKAAPKEEPVEVEEEGDDEEGDDEGDDDDMPELEDPAAAGDDKKDGKGGKQNRSEKKSRKAMQKLGMKQVPGIVRVTVKKAKNILFVISKPDVFKSPASDTYVIFGEAKIEDINAQAQANAADAFKANPAAAAVATEADKEVAEPVVEEETGDVDETGLDADEINTVMSQANCTRVKAVKALRKNKNIVDAILELTP